MHAPTPASLWRTGEERLEWQGFLARFFPDRSRQDFEALAAYESYVNDVERRPADGAAARALGRASGAAHATRSEPTQRNGDEQEPPATPDTERWEGDGGASTGRPRRTRRDERPVGKHSG